MLQLTSTPLFCIEQKHHVPGTSVNEVSASLATPEGIWLFHLYGNNIIKASFQPNGYFTNELVSNAVIQKPSQGKSIAWQRSEEKIFLGASTTISFSDKGFSFAFNGSNKDLQTHYFHEDYFRGFRFKLQEGEHIFGGGERALDLDRRGHGFGLYNSPAYGYGEGAGDLNYSVPFIISSRGYGIFFDNASRGYLDIGKKSTEVLEAGFCSGELNFYVINGRNVDEILRNYTELVGRQPIPARWVLGNLMSRFGYRSEEQLMKIVKRMTEEEFPVDAVILDLFWFGDSVKNTMGNLDWVNQERWPDPAKMMLQLKKAGIKTILITEPYLLMGAKNYTASKEFHAVDSSGKPYILTNFYFGFGGLLDLFRKGAQNWFWARYKKQVENGVSGWWGDLGEPETHPADIHHNLQDAGFNRLFKADEVHNVFGHNWNKMLFEKYQEEYPSTRLFNLNRAGFAGSQRYSVFPWSGDVGRNWSGLRAQLPIMLGMSISGLPYIHSDAGGFAMGRKDPELYTRWLQFAAFTPVFRPHGTTLEEVDDSIDNIESEPVFYPEPYKSIVRRYIRLRYSLLPYNYTLAYEQASAGKPLTRPLFYYDSTDENLLAAGDQFMWGENLMIAPVLQKGATERKLYLPKGIWYRYLTNIKIKGGQWINEKVDINDIPFYVKAGAFIPTSPNLQNTGAYNTGSLTVTYFPGSEHSHYTLFDDDGETNRSWEEGHYELLYFTARPEETKYSFQVSSNKGWFSKRPPKRTITLVVPGLNRMPLEVKLNGVSLKLDQHFSEPAEADIARATWNPLRATLSITFHFAADTQSIELTR